MSRLITGKTINSDLEWIVDRPEFTDKMGEYKSFYNITENYVRTLQTPAEKSIELPIYAYGEYVVCIRRLEEFKYEATLHYTESETGDEFLLVRIEI